SFKSKSLSDFINLHMSNINIEIATNLQCAITKVNNSLFDLILIDMAIPSHPIHSGTGSPINLLNGGLQVILELQYLKRSDNCIVLTQYPDIEICGEYFPVKNASINIKELLDCTVLDCIQYSEDSTTWKNELKANLANYENFNS
ncbi:TPA: response regulator, partial [Acinetobacter baumannii]